MTNQYRFHRTVIIGQIAAIIIALCIMLGGCDTGPSRGDDRHDFTRREFDRPTVTVTKVEYASVSALRDGAKRRGVPVEQDRELYAFGFVDRSKPVCEIHFVAPEALAQRRWIGHEMAHCFYGRWHK